MNKQLFTLLFAFAMAVAPTLGAAEYRPNYGLRDLTGEELQTLNAGLGLNSGDAARAEQILQVLRGQSYSPPRGTAGPRVEGGRLVSLSLYNLEEWSIQGALRSFYEPSFNYYEFVDEVHRRIFNQEYAAHAARH